MTIKRLDNVTLIAVGSTHVRRTIKALEYSMQGIQFAESKIVTHKNPFTTKTPIQYEPCDELTSSKAYSHYILYNLRKHVNTEFCLLIQYDGFVINPDKWEDKFLEWDYIGAAWPIRENAYIDPFGNHQRVGNGGFTLRSRKLLEVPHIEEIPFEVNQGTFYKHMNAGYYNEDGNICVHNRHLFEKHGVKFAPVEVAVKFSQELKVPESEGVIPFGFHCYLPSGTVLKRTKNEHN